jgi:hypothetical protein
MHAVNSVLVLLLLLLLLLRGYACALAVRRYLRHR